MAKKTTSSTSSSTGVVVRHTTQANVNRFFDVAEMKKAKAKAEAKAKVKKKTKAKARKIRDTTQENIDKFFASSIQAAASSSPAPPHPPAQPNPIEILRQWCTSELRKATRVEHVAATDLQHARVIHNRYMDEMPRGIDNSEALAELDWDLCFYHMTLDAAREEVETSRQLMKQLSTVCK